MNEATHVQFLCNPGAPGVSRTDAVKSMVRNASLPLPFYSVCVECNDVVKMESVKDVPLIDTRCRCGSTWLIRWVVWPLSSNQAVSKH